MLVNFMISQQHVHSR